MNGDLFGLFNAKPCYRRAPGAFIAPRRRTELTAIGARQGELAVLMSGARSQNLQDVFLNYVRKQKMPVTVFLINGVKLQGVITSFDNFCMMLRRDGHSQLVYKHAISTVMPSSPINLQEAAEDADGEAE